MNSNPLLIVVLFLTGIQCVLSLVSPCHYVKSNKNFLQCDLCRCLTLTSNLCSFFNRSADCSDDDKQKHSIELVDRSLLQSSFELKSFNEKSLEIFFQQVDLCYSHLTLIHFQSHIAFNDIPRCLTTIYSLAVIDSFLDNTYWFRSMKFTRLVVFNTTWRGFQWDSSNLVEHLHFSSVRFLDRSFMINSSSALIHLTVNFIFHYELIGTFPHLSYLNLAQTNLTDRQWNRVLQQIQCPDLTTLILHHNHLTTVTNHFPSTIRYLDLSHNQIKSLDYYSFRSLYSLNLLNLSSNFPLEIQQETFTRTPYLEVLDLSSSLPTLALDDLFVPLQKLRYLNLSANQLDAFPLLPIPYDVHSIDHYDQDLPVLNVDLSKNLLDHLPVGMFSGTQDKYILTINVNENQIKTLTFPQSKRRGPFIEFDLRYNSLQCDCHLYQSVDLLRKLDVKIHRLKLLHLTNLTCRHSTDDRLLLDLQPSESFCSYNDTCPQQCSCQRSADFTINRVNCSHRQLKQIPEDLPLNTTHLYLNNNDIEQISSTIFDDLTQLIELYLHDNPWRPRCDADQTFNPHIIFFTYANQLICNYSLINCCESSSSINRTNFKSPDALISSQRIRFGRKSRFYLLIGLSLSLVLMLLSLLIFLSHKKLLPATEVKNKSNPYDKPLIPVQLRNSHSNVIYEQSLSITDEDDYASIPLTTSQTDLNNTRPSVPAVIPPLPPRRHFLSPRPQSHSSTVSTITTATARSISAPIRSCLQIKLDVLVLYSINDSELIHEHLAHVFESIYGKRFSFYFVHRDRMLGELDWLIQNSCVTLLILRQPYHIIRDYAKLFSTCSMVKCFIIMINNDPISLKLREKIARHYRTTNIYQWNVNPNSLVHEQLDLFLELNCGSATYVTD